MSLLHQAPVATFLRHACLAVICFISPSVSRAESILAPPPRVDLAFEPVATKTRHAAALPDLRPTIKYVMSSSASVKVQKRVSYVMRGLAKLSGLEFPDAPFYTAGSGSGVIVDGHDGLVLTAAHVVEQSERVVLVLRTVNDEVTEAEATVLAIDEGLDIAVLHVNPEVLTGHEAAEIGSAADLQIGDWVITVGDPAGLTQSASLGILSGKRRTVPYTWSSGEVKLNTNLLQSDALIMSGSSGGPLYSAEGFLVGLNVANLGGVTFSVPIDSAMMLLPHAREALALADMLVPEGQPSKQP